ncbi:MAG: response regulator [Acidobacteria bacterium]|nr:response regulator [Acidobacteriota bacterium]
MSRTRLLLADDSVSVQRIIELTFVDEDVDVVAVGGGHAAIEDIRRQPPDIVLADTRMPEGDGYEVADFVRKDPDLSRIPVVLLTGAFDPIDTVRAQEVGSRGVLVKPFEAQQVIGTVRDLLAAGDGAAASVPVPAAAPATPPAAAAGVFAASASPAAPIEQWPQPSAGVPPAPVPPPVEPAAESDAGASAAGPVLVAEGSVLADAFAALLAAERRAAEGDSAPLAAGASHYQLPEAIVSDLVDRVVSRLSDTYLREQAAAVVSEVAERVVREEIARAGGNAG